MLPSMSGYGDMAGAPEPQEALRFSSGSFTSGS